MGARHCLLVVDDEPEVVHSVQDLLRLDYRVLGATRAADGLRLLEREPVHIVMSDQRMPEMTGVEFLRQLRDCYPDVVRLLFTGYADLDAMSDAINQGSVFRYVTKPWNPGELQSAVREAAAHYDLLAERKRLLAELQEKNRRLEAMNAALREANDLKLAFIKVASHELRTPLTIVLGLSELARCHREGHELMPQWLDQIHSGSRRLNRLVESIVQMLLAGQFDRPLERVRVPLSELLHKAAHEVAAFVDRRRQELVVDAPAELGALDGDRNKLRDALTHLLLNAIKFTPDGGAIRLEGRRLPDGSVQVRVADTGVGIDAASLRHVFDPFFTGFDSARHSSGVYEFGRRGLGLGLTLVKAFVEMHGGRVDVTSEVGRGSTFTLTFPAQVSPAAESNG